VSEYEEPDRHLEIRIEDLEEELKAIRAAFPCDLALRARLFRLGACSASGDPWQALARIIERAEEG
jgi:hypothetical protein